MREIGDLTELPLTPKTRENASRLQGLLWHGGLVRAVGVFDTLTAATALEHGATVVHYDRDFELLASVCPGFTQQWVAPAGSIP
jgi:predicted nucleic acid-binding protein